MAGERLAGDVARFLFAGGLNTALTSFVYVVSLAVVPSSLAYAAAWLTGLAFVMVFYPDRVFPGGRNATTDRLSIGASVVAVFLVGLATLNLLEQVLANAVAAFFVTLALTTFLNFAISRLILRRSY